MKRKTKNILKALAALTLSASMGVAMAFTTACTNNGGEGEGQGQEQTVTYSLNLTVAQKAYTITTENGSVSVAGGTVEVKDSNGNTVTSDWNVTQTLRKQGATSDVAGNAPWTISEGGTYTLTATATKSGQNNLTKTETITVTGYQAPGGGGGGATTYKDYATLAADANAVIKEDFSTGYEADEHLALHGGVYGVRGVYTDKETDATYIKVTGGAAQQVGGENFNMVIDFGPVSGVVEGYVEYTPNAVGSSWKIAQFMSSGNSTLFSITTDNGKDNTASWKYAIGANAAVDAKESVAIEANVLYKLYYKADLTTNKITVYLNEKCIADEVEVTGLAELDGLRLATSSGGSRTLKVDNIAVVNEADLAAYKTAASALLDKAKSKYADGYDTNQADITSAYDTASAAITGAADKAAIDTALKTAINAMAAVESDADLALKARDKVTTDVEIPGTPDVADFATPANAAGSGKTTGISNGAKFGTSEWLTLTTTTSDTKWKVETSGSGINAKGAVFTVNTTVANSTFVINYYSTSDNRYVTITKDGNQVGKYAQKEANGVGITLATAGAYTVTFDSANGDHKVASMSLAAPVSGSKEVFVDGLTANVTATTGLTITDVVMSFEVVADGVKGTKTLTSGDYTVIVKKDGVVVSDTSSLEAGEYTVIIIYGASKQESDAKVTNSYTTTVTVS